MASVSDCNKMSSSVSDCNKLNSDVSSPLVCLPMELIVKIFSFLDNQTIDALGNVNTLFQEIISSSVQIWKRKIHEFTLANPQYKHILSNTEYPEIKKLAGKLRKFYSRLLKINENITKGNFKRINIHCLEAELKGRTVKQNPEWNRHHNYKGVYDMILYKGMLCASVYDTIQIWDTKTMKIAHFFTNAILDQDGSKTKCFTLTENYLICGSDNGYVKILDIETEKILTRARVNSNYLSEVKMKGGSLVTLDWFGKVTQWELLPGPVLKPSPENDDKFKVPALLNSRDYERLLDFNSEYLVTTYKSHITVYRNGEFVQSSPVYSEVFCIGIQNNLLAFGCKGERRVLIQPEVAGEPLPRLAPVAGITSFDQPRRTIYFRTVDNDPVISLQLTSRYLFLGDVNGEIHIINIEQLKFPERDLELYVDFEDLTGRDYWNEVGCRLERTIRSHSYRDFVWALVTDGFRIFSGDETGQVIVHDFFHVDETADPSTPADTTANKASISKESTTADKTADNAADNSTAAEKASISNESTTADKSLIPDVATNSQQKSQSADNS